MRRGDALLTTASALVAAALVAAVYLPDIGRGFIKDDFGWIRDAREALGQPSHVLSPESAGFYRPVVTASFAADYALHGLNARAYGFTNLTIYLLCAVAVWLLLRDAGVTTGAAAVGAFAWAMNPHGINMAVVWLSGRTSLLLTLFATTSTIAFLKGRRVTGALLLFAALLSKEEATVLPFLIGAWLILLRERTRRERLVDVVALVAPLVVYAVLRMRTPAMTPATAPSFYTPTSDLRLLAANLLEYVDRGATAFGVVVLVAMIAYRSTMVGTLARRAALAGVAWFVGGYAITVWLPIRSSLYAVFPSVGAALVCAAAIDALRARRGAVRDDLRMAAALATILAFIPVYQQRNDRWVEPARLSARTVRLIQADLPPPGTVVFEDEPRRYASFEEAFGALADVAVSELAHRPMFARIVTPPAHWDGPAAARYRVTAGRVERVE